MTTLSEQVKELEISNVFLREDATRARNLEATAKDNYQHVLTSLRYRSSELGDCSKAKEQLHKDNQHNKDRIKELEEELRATQSSRDVTRSSYERLSKEWNRELKERTRMIKEERDEAWDKLSKIKDVTC